MVKRNIKEFICRLCKGTGEELIEEGSYWNLHKEVYKWNCHM